MSAQLKVNLKRIPRIVRLICGSYDAWIVGGASDPNQSIPKDYDVCVPFRQWKEVALLIPKDARPTLYGGWKFQCDGFLVDVWPQDLGDVLICAKCKWAWQPQHNIRITKVL